MKQAVRKLAIIFFCIGIIVLLGVSGIWYYRQVNKQVYRSMIDNIQELAEHDLNAIMTNVEKNWNQLDSIHVRMKYYEYSSIKELQKRLHVEQNTGNIEKIYYVSEDGELYSGDYMIEKNETLFAAFEEEDDRFVSRYDDVDTSIPELRREYLLYGIRIEPWEVNGKIFVGLLSQVSVDNMRDELVIESYDGQGFSSVVDENGDYIINVNPVLSFQERENFNSIFENGQFLKDGEDIASIKQNLLDGKSYTTIYRAESGEEKVMTFWKIDRMNWYMIMEVSRDVFREQTNSIINLSLIAGILVVLAVTLSLGIWFMAMRKSLHGKAQLEARNDFLSNMSHEIRTPLNGLIGLNHLMIQHIDDKEKMSGYLRKASYTANYLLALVNDVLDMSKLQAGKVELHMDSANLEILLDNVISMQRENIEERGLELCVDLGLQEPWIVCDEVRVKQVLMNLLSNAAKFTSPGGKVTIRMRQEIMEEGGEKHGVKTYCEVEDTGCGMSEEFQKHIFEAFTQEREHNAESQKGTGLGMSISYLLMKAMEGTLSVKSSLGEGSTFYLSFPAEIVPKESRGSTAAEHNEVPVELDLEQMHILIAEDNELNAEILTELLEEYHITSEVAVNGREAVEMFSASASGTYSVILMDIQMPEMNGYEAAKRIRGLNRVDAVSVRILACTANTFQEDIDRVMESGMDGFIGKPIDIEELFLKLKEKKV